MFKIRSSFFLQIFSLVLILGNELLATDFLSIADGTPVYRANVGGVSKFVANQKGIIGAKEAHRRGITGKNVKVAVIDHEYDFGSDTRANLLPECLARSPAVGTADYYLRQNKARITGGSHSNHVSSTIAGKNGIAPDVQLDVFDLIEDPAIKNTANPLAAAIYQAINDKVDFINISLKMYNYSYDLRQAYLAARDAGIGIIQAATNDDEVLGSTPLTQSLSQLLVDMNGFMRLVVSTRYTSQGDELLAVMSNSAGSASKYVISAPGDDILAYGAMNSLLVLSGTSMASPAVTGAAALLKSANLNMPADQIFDEMSKTARKHNLKTHMPLDSGVFGQGVVSVIAALDKLDAEAQAAAAQAAAAQAAAAHAAAAQAAAAQAAAAQAAAVQAAAAQAAAAQAAVAQAAAAQAKAAQAAAAQAAAAQAKAAQAAKVKAAQAAKVKAAQAAKAKAAQAAKAKAAKENQDARRFLTNNGVVKITQADINKIKAVKSYTSKLTAVYKIKKSRM